MAAQLKKSYGLTHVCSGHMLRQEVETGSALGRRSSGYLEQGELVPDETVFEVMGAWMQTVTSALKFALDGFPRTLNQARTLDTWLDEKQLPIEVAVLFKGDEGQIIERILGRRSCPRCVRRSPAPPPRAPAPAPCPGRCRRT